MNRHTLLLLTICIAATACKKEKEETPAPTGPPAPTITHRGEFSAFRSVDDFGWGPVENNSVSAIVTMADGTTMNVDSVRANGVLLGNLGPGTYFTIGMDLSTEALVWDLGSEAADIAFTHSSSGIGYPTVSAITSGGNVPSGSSYTLSCGTITGADSVYFSLGGLWFAAPGNVTSHTFSAAEIQALVRPESHMASIQAMRIQRATYDGMACRFGKASSRTVMVLVE
ncbi:MAG: hypothetical protein KF797_02765 [Flavobacteriales bacterium]|nr:hypothetical protein [Flavobacteriales bacterium]